MTNSAHPSPAGLTPVTIFVACPGDCATEKTIVSEVARELELLANHHRYVLKVRDWSQVSPNIGRPQRVIFDQIPVTGWDILVGVLWLRFGTKSGGTNPITGVPTESGTEEEFASALEVAKSTGRPRILFYRRTAGPPDVSRLDLPQLKLVQEFFKKFEPGQPYEGLYKAYETPEDFRRLLREHLMALLVGGGTRLDQSTEAASTSGDISSRIVSFWRERLLATYDVLKLHRISSAYDAGSVLRADRDRVRLHDVFVPQHVCDVSAFVAERLPAPHDLATADADELRLLGMQHHQQLRKAKRHQVFDITEADKNRKIVLLGDPGAGKSSLLQHRALTWARDKSGAGPLPLLLEMRQYAARVVRAREERKTQPSLISWAGEMLGSAASVGPVPEEAITTGLSTASVVLYCDALDEIFDPELRRTTAEQLAQLAAKMPAVRIVVTSRPVGYPDDVLSTAGYSHWMVQDFDNKQIQEFLARWVVAALPDDDDRANVISRMNSALEIGRVREMAGNPLLLTLMSILARTDELPRDRMRLYAKAAELLLYQWDTSRSLRPIKGLDFAYEQKHRVLRELAWRMQNTQLGLGGNLASLEMVRDVFDDELKADLDRPGDRAHGVSLLLETLRVRDHVLCHLGGDRFAFVHRGFLEYFCADWLYERVRRSPSTAEKDLFKIFQRYALVASWGEVLSLGVLALAPEVADPILAKIEPVVTKRGRIPRWLSAATLTDDKAKARYPKTTSMLRAKINKEIQSRESVSALLTELARFWPDEETRIVVSRLARRGRLTQKARKIAMDLLGQIWPNEETRSILTSVAQKDQGRAGRAAVLQLGKNWRDEAVKSVLMEVAAREPSSRASAVAVRALAQHWQDHATRELLQSIADRNNSTKQCLAASRELERKWGSDREVTS
jgi:hypothetical protein